MVCEEDERRILEGDIWSSFLDQLDEVRSFRWVTKGLICMSI